MPAIVKMQDKNKNFFSFRKFQARLFAPVVGFFDLKSIIEPVRSCRNHPKFLEMRTIEMHNPCSYALLFIAQSQDEPFHFECDRVQRGMQKFLESLEKMAQTKFVKKKTKQILQKYTDNRKNLTLKTFEFAILH